MLLDASAGGTMKVKTADEVREMINIMSLNEYQGHTEEEATPKKKGVTDLNTQDCWVFVLAALLLKQISLFV